MVLSQVAATSAKARRRKQEAGLATSKADYLDRYVLGEDNEDVPAWKSWQLAEEQDEKKLAGPRESIVLGDTLPLPEVEVPPTLPKMTAFEIEQMLADVVNGVPAPEGESKSRRETREQLIKEVDEIRARGHIVDIPFEIPDITED